VALVGCDHTEVVLDSRELADRDLSRAVIQAADFPLSTSGDMLSSLYRLFQAVRAKSTVALSGESSDEVFGGYPWFHDPKAIDAATFPWVAAEVLENRSHPARSLLIFHYAEKACSAQGIQYWPAQRINGKLCTTERDGVFGFPEGD
jgi:asparagine synthetase B (glutamine-hydrolysing)